MENKLEIFDIEQGTPEWFEIREEVMTASHADAIGNAGAGLETYIKEMMMEKYSTGEKVDYKNEDMQRGTTNEPVARDIYSFMNNVEVKQVGFIKINKYVGCSPDGLVLEEGGWECKSLSDKVYFEYLLNPEKEPEKKHKWQCQMCLKITGRKWWDLMYYNPNFKNSYKIWRIYPDQEMFNALDVGFAKGVELINNIKAKIEND